MLQVAISANNNSGVFSISLGVIVWKTGYVSVGPVIYGAFCSSKINGITGGIVDG